jgi:hypothetical protein
VEQRYVSLLKLLESKSKSEDLELEWIPSRVKDAYVTIIWGYGVEVSEMSYNDQVDIQIRILNQDLQEIDSFTDSSAALL